MPFVSPSSPLLRKAAVAYAQSEAVDHAAQMRTVPALVSSCTWSRLTARFGKTLGHWKQCV